jgi:hypothetical protein
MMAISALSEHIAEAVTDALAQCFKRRIPHAQPAGVAQLEMALVSMYAARINRGD